MLNFDFLDEGLEIASPAYFVYDFIAEMFRMLCVLKLFVNQVVTS